MPFDINAFAASGLKYGGARPSLFAVEFSLPAALLSSATAPTTAGVAPKGSSGGLSISSISRLTCKAASIPESALSHIDVGYFGRKIKVPGSRTFSNWDVTVNNDENFLTRALLESWSNAINRLESNVRDPALDIEAYKVDMIVRQYSKPGVEIRAYTMIGAWPSLVSKIALDWDNSNAIETFDTSFAYDYFLPSTERTTDGAPTYGSAATNPGNATAG